MAQVITWANVDPDFCHKMVSLGHNELMDLTITSVVTSAVWYKTKFGHQIW